MANPILVTVECIIVMKLVAALLCICISVDLSAQIAARGFTAKNGEFIGFQEYRPTDYASSPAAHPLIIFLHGVGEKGNGKSQLRDVWCCGLPSYIKRGIPMRFTWNGKTESFVVLIPQLNPKYSRWQSFYVNELINYAITHLRINPNRIFVTGLSLGGGGTWIYASESVSNAKRLAGIVPVVGPCQMSNGCNIARANLPVLAVHALDDKTASPSCTINAIKEINNCGATVSPNVILYPNGGHAVWLKRAYSVDHEYQNPNVYEWMLAQDKSLHPNKKPRARAGGDQSVASGASSKLNGSESSDPDGKILRYIWRKIAGPTGGNISNAIASTTTITSLNKGTYKYELKVVDDRAEWSLDTITIRVGNGGPTTNAAPVADAGDNQAIVLPASSAILDGELSYDDDGTIGSYLWSYVSGPQGATIENKNSARTKVSGLVTGKYVFRLTVTDNKGATDQDVVTIQVYDEGTTPPPSVADDLPPIARAGEDVQLRLPVSMFILNGEASEDPDGEITAYHWQLANGPAAVNISNADEAVASVADLQEGTYEFRLTVTDNDGNNGSDIIVVTAGINGNESPVAKAGEDCSISGNDDFFILDGTGSYDNDGKIDAYQWRKIIGPDNGSIENSLAAQTKFRNAQSGTYEFELSVKDNHLAIALDTVRISFEFIPKEADAYIYPNPVKNNLNLHLNGTAQGRFGIAIIDVNGRKIFEKSLLKNTYGIDESLPTTALNSGVYFIQITGKQKIQVIKFVKER
jgi:predicted esterase